MDSQEEPTNLCENCDKQIPESKWFLHEAYCFRNIIRCAKCNEPIHKNEVDAHNNEAHRLSSCPHCKKDFEIKALGKHVETCTEKPKMCYFCKCEISNKEFDDHAYQCGSRTRKCMYCNKNVLMRELEDHEAICAVEQFSRDTTAESKYFEENKDDLLEEMLAGPKNRESGPDSRLIFKKSLEPIKKDAIKKRLTKLIEKKGASMAGKTQEEVDEELAKELNEEFYEGRSKHGRNKLRIDDDDDDDGEFNSEAQNKSQEMTKKTFQSKHLTRRTTENIKPANTRMETRASREKEDEEEFYGLKKNNRTRMEIEKEDDEEAFTRSLQSGLNKGPQTRAKRVTRVSRTVTYNDASEDVVETQESEFYQQNYEDNDPELSQFLNEDAELQRAIQASLEHH